MYDFQEVVVKGEGHPSRPFLFPVGWNVDLMADTQAAILVYKVACKGRVKGASE